MCLNVIKNNYIYIFYLYKQILPLCVCIKKNHLNHDFFDMFVNKIFDVTCTTVQRLAYNMRDIIRKGDLPMEQICKVSIDLLLEILDIMDRVSI